ncbi:hypothetical protein [Terrabacter sp. Ter38]|uniref:hypothetical protein n=1 Tax=Terrabacter sp. Ter38 TaxID=2926030 RepID=UPI002117E150|nr:hypothetical protein [Terrabacter sp. Ter38]
MSRVQYLGAMQPKSVNLAAVESANLLVADSLGDAEDAVVALVQREQARGTLYEKPEQDLAAKSEIEGE